MLLQLNSRELSLSYQFSVPLHTRVASHGSTPTLCLRRRNVFISVPEFWLLCLVTKFPEKNTVSFSPMAPNHRFNRNGYKLKLIQVFWVIVSLVLFSFKGDLFRASASWMPRWDDYNLLESAFTRWRTKFVAHHAAIRVFRSEMPSEMSSDDRQWYYLSTQVRHDCNWLQLNNVLANCGSTARNFVVWPGNKGTYSGQTLEFTHQVGYRELIKTRRP